MCRAMRYTQADRLEKLGTQKFVYAQPLDSFARINIVLAVVIVVVIVLGISFGSWGN